MTQFICWALFPAALALVSLGCGWLLEWASGRPLPEPVVLPAGLAVVLVVAELTTKLSSTARFTTPAVVEFMAAQSALTSGYSSWGGVEEVAAAWLVALTIASVVPVLDAQARARSFLPLAAASFAMLGVLGYGGAVWLALPLVVVAFGAVRIWIRRSARWQVAGLIGLGALLALGLIRGAQGFLKANGSLTGSELGNLTHPLNPLQVFGIWPAGDFRVDPPNSATLAGVLIGVVIVALLAGLFVCWRRRWWLPVLYLATAAAGALLVSVRGSPWVQGKAFATISPAA